MWEKYQACVNCGTSDRPHRGNGYCSLCRGPAMQIREVLAWDQAEPRTLRRYPGDFRRATPRDFELMRQGYIRELQRRLDQVSRWEQSLGTDVKSIQLEHQLSRVAHHAGVRSKDLLFGQASRLDRHFGPAQRQVLHDILLTIEMARPWRGVNLTKVFMYQEEQLLAPTEG